MTRTSPHGPAPLYGQTMKRHMVALDAGSIAIARALGKGNLSGGIREALRLAAVTRHLDQVPVPSSQASPDASSPDTALPAP